MNNKPLVSIVIPAHNEQKYIRDCLKSLKNQTYSPIEIIVVDNASTDKTNVIAREEGVSVVYEANPGVCYARQSGTQKANGEIIVSTDADTVFHKNWINNIVDTFEKYPDAVAVGGTFVLDDDAPWWGNFIFTDIVFGIIKTIYNINGKAGNLFGSNTAFKKEAWEGYDTKLTQGGDEVVLLRQLRKKGRVVFIFDNPVITSSRRLDKGFWHFLIFYVFDYFYCIITGKSLVAPRAIRLQNESNI